MAKAGRQDLTKVPVYERVRSYIFSKANFNFATEDGDGG